MEQERDVQTVYFKDLIFSTLYQWKAVLVVGIALALLLGAFAFLRNRNNTVTLNSITITPDTQIKIDQLKSSIEQTERNIEEYTLYLEESAWMQLDPLYAYTAGMHIFVHTDSAADLSMDQQEVSASVKAILRSYRSYLIHSDTMTTLGEEFNLNAKYMTELVTFDSSDPSVLGITVRGRDAEETQLIADSVAKLVQAQTPQISQSIAPHTITCVPFFTGPKMDTDLNDGHNAANNKLATLKNNLLSYKTELNRYQPTELIAGHISPILLAVISAVLGACLVAAFAWIRHFGSGKVYSARVLTNRTSLQVLGCVRGSKKYDFITRWLRKLEGRSESTSHALSVNIRNRCADAKQLLISGNYTKNELSELTEVLEKSGITCILCNDLSEDADAMEALPKCDMVLLAETCHKSRYDSIQWAMQTVADYNKPLLGCLLIDG